MSRHEAGPMFAAAHITSVTHTEESGDTPVRWRRWTRWGKTVLFVMTPIRPPGTYTGRHRRYALMRSGAVRFAGDGWRRGIENQNIVPRHLADCQLRRGHDYDDRCFACSQVR